MKVPQTPIHFSASLPDSFYLPDFTGPDELAEDVFEVPIVLTRRTTEMLLNSFARAFDKLKGRIYDVLDLVNVDNFPDALLEATLELKNLKKEFYDLRLLHEEGHPQTNSTLRTLRGKMFALEVEIRAIQEEVNEQGAKALAP